MSYNRKFLQDEGFQGLDKFIFSYRFKSSLMKQTSRHTWANEDDFLVKCSLMLYNETPKDKDSILRHIVTHYCILVRKGVLDQLISAE